MTMQGTVISYVYESDGLPRNHRQHIVPNILDEDAITEQVRTERIDVPEGSFVDWVL